MANHESTAVNELIDLVQSGKPLGDPGDDMFSSPPRPRVASAPPPVPSMQPAVPPRGEVVPLPPMRAPTGTSQLALPKDGPVRMITAPPSRSTTIPPIPGGKAQLPAPTRASRSNTAAPLPPPRSSTSAPPAPASRTTTSSVRTLPPSTAPVAAPFETKPADDNPFVAQPVVGKPAPAGKPPRASTIDETGDAVAADGWFEASRGVDKIDETWMGTVPVERLKRSGSGVRRFILPTIVLVGAGLAVGAYIGHHRHAATTTAPAAPAAQVAKTAANPALDPTQATPPAPPAPVNPLDPTQATPPAPPAPAPGTAAAATAPDPNAAAAPAAAAAAPAAATAPVAAAAPATAPAPATASSLVSVRLDSRPSGATVMLVDNGKTTFLGTTPVAASLDAARAYDVVFTLSGHPTQMAHIDPSRTTHLDVTLGGGAPAPATAAVAAPATSHHHERATLPQPARVAHATHHATRATATGGNGTLMVSSKPPCEIVIDGRRTGLMTPQRAISLSPGAHKITFVNAAEHVNRTVAVSIHADHATKLIENLMR